MNQLTGVFMNDTTTEAGTIEHPKPAKKKSTLDLKFLSHGTLESKDLDFTRKFYEEFMGFEVIRPAKISLWIRLGGNNIYAVVQALEGRKTEMNFLNHNGVDVETEDDVDDSWCAMPKNGSSIKSASPRCSMVPTVSTSGIATITPGRFSPIRRVATVGCSSAAIRKASAT